MIHEVMRVRSRTIQFTTAVRGLGAKTRLELAPEHIPCIISVTHLEDRILKKRGIS